MGKYSGLIPMWAMCVVLCASGILGLDLSHEANKNHTYTFNLVRQRSYDENVINHGHLLGSVFKDDYKPKPGPPRDNDSIALKRFLNDEFYGEIVIGHPGQKLYVSFDTSWDISWVISSKCSSIKAPQCWLHNKYDHKKSSEYRKDGRPFNLDLGNFNLTGFYSYDNISIAHSNATAQSFVEMVEIPRSFVFNKADGILGLGLKTGSYDPFFYTLMNQKKIKNPLFSIYLNRDTQSTRGGNIMLGFINDKHIHKTVRNKTVIPDEITYLNVDSNLAYWQFTVDRIIVNKTTALCPSGCKAIVDSSSNVIFGPKKDVDEIHDAMDAHEFFLNRYTVNCDTVNKLPKIEFVLGGKNFTLSGPQYTVKMSYNFVTLCVSTFMPDTTIQEQDRWVLGGAFLAEFYSIYDVQAKKIGFVRAS